MRTLLIFLFTINTFLSNSQDKVYKISYQVENSQGLKLETLIFNDTASVYRTNIQNIPDNKGNTYASSRYFKNTDNILFFERNAILVRDSIPDIIWYLTDEKKLIGDFVCKKATTIFRGTFITAYYNEEISTSFGPWKFNGLPGLIISLYTEKMIGFRSWTLKQIEIIESKTNVLNLDKSKYTEVISFEDFISKRDLKNKTRSRRTISRLPTEFNKTKVEFKRTGIEKVFEWELKDEKK
ncbi:GLPGLI family protein [Nonlabens sp.]|uniref:GLPGLI family protein n=1 Tax=Nonlabens sp. TaxID=1888209 RepID=UPI003F6990E7